MLIRRFDAWLCWRSGVFEFSDDPDCVLRLQVTRAPHTLHLGNQTVEAGEPALALHLWNEHIPSLPPTGPDLAWAIRMRRLLVQSFRAAAQQMGQNRRLADVRVVGGTLSLFSVEGYTGEARLMQRLGFTVLPYTSPLGRFGEFWENFYAWWIMWTFNAASLRTRQLLHMRRSQMWMSADEFLSRYGAANEGMRDGYKTNRF